MRLQAGFVAIAALFLMGVVAGRQAGGSRAVDSLPRRQPVIVELFTSEGCSSCPPADALLKELAEEQPMEGAEIIALEEHVDYWNSQGWTDPFSSEEFSIRQREYAELLPRGGVYTPQMIVDGHAQFVGSRGKEAREQIRTAASAAKGRLSLTVTPDSQAHGYSVELRMDAESTMPSASPLELYVAITEKGLHSRPTAGENSGEALAHAPVVRELRKLHAIRFPLREPVRFRGRLREEWVRGNLTMVAFLVAPRSGQIVAAGSSPVPGPR